MDLERRVECFETEDYATMIISLTRSLSISQTGQLPACHGQVSCMLDDSQCSNQANCLKESCSLLSHLFSRYTEGLVTTATLTSCKHVIGIPTTGSSQPSFFLHLYSPPPLELAPQYASITSKSQLLAISRIPRSFQH